MHMPLESMAGWKKLTVIKQLLKRLVDTDLFCCRAWAGQSSLCATGPQDSLFLFPDPCAAASAPADGPDSARATSEQVKPCTPYPYVGSA